jgi:hypothetical protein
MTDIPLTPRLAAKLAAIFPPEDRTFAEQWLIAECGSDLPLIHSAPELLQRVRAAALKFSQGPWIGWRWRLAQLNRIGVTS